MRTKGAMLGLVAFAAVMVGGAAQELNPVASQKAPSALTPVPNKPPTLASLPAVPSSVMYVIRFDHWSEEDERGFGEFITSLGESKCRTVDDCLHGPGNPFRASDVEGIYFKADCADFPYFLRAYYAWKRGLPFSYESEVEPRGASRDIRYTREGNSVVERHDVLSLSTSGYALLETIRDVISSATYRIHPDLDAPLPPDHYSPAIDAKSIRPGTVIYDPNGHLATVFRVDPDGRIAYIDAHPDNTVTHGFYDVRFVRSRPGMGAGFKNWRSVALVGATRRADGILIGGHMELPANKNIPNYSEEQFFGTGQRPADMNWSAGMFVLNDERLDYYDYVRAKLAGGKLQFDPVKEVHDMVASNCDDLHYRALAVDIAIAAGINRHPQPDRLPPNIYGTEGDWETYSTPSRDARLKTAFKELRDQTERFVKMYQAGDKKLIYQGSDLVGDLIRTYDAGAAACSVGYTRSDSSPITLSYEEARKRLFAMSFDPYQCAEHRWGAHDPGELITCNDGAEKRAWYEAEKYLRNQIDRTYEAQMDFGLDGLKEPGPGKGVATPPDIDVRAYLLSVRGAVAGASPTPVSAP
ncbi:MAG: hypothetical protein HY243_08430 [Proteobacteria bacterium]|nr:hypothetical protein [Pseudomonadota bacterium]